MTLTAKQQRFVDEYVADPNATQAMIRAGYSPRSARQNGHRMLTNADISEAVAEARAELAERTGVGPDLVMHEYRRLAFSDLRDAVQWSGRSMTIRNSDELTPDAARAIQEVTETVTETPEGGTRTVRRVKLYDKLGALRDVAKMLGMFPKESSSGVNVGVTVNVGDRPKADLSKMSDEELDFYERFLANTASEPVPND